MVTPFDPPQSSCIGRAIGTYHVVNRESVMVRNRFMPWFMGLAIIVVGDAIALLMTDEGPAELAQQTALIVIPMVALGLMFLMFKSQK